MFEGDFHQFKNLIVKVTCFDGREYTGVATSFRDHDDTSLPVLIVFVFMKAIQIVVLISSVQK